MYTKERYRVYHGTWQLVNSFECLLPQTLLEIKDFFIFADLLKITLTQLKDGLLWNQYYDDMTGIYYGSLFSEQLIEEDILF